MGPAVNTCKKLQIYSCNQTSTHICTYIHTYLQKHPDIFTCARILMLNTCIICLFIVLYIYIYIHVGRDSVVGIATYEWLDGLGIEFRWVRDFLHLSRADLGPTEPPVRWVPGHLLGVKAVGSWRWPPTVSRAEIKERVEVHPYSISETSWPELGWNLHIHTHIYIYICLHTYLHLYIY